MGSAEETPAMRMGLMIQEQFSNVYPNDELETVGTKAFDCRKAIANAIKATKQTDMADGFKEGNDCWMFATERDTANVRCNFLVATGEISAIIPKAELPGSATDDKAMAPETYVYKTPMIEWSKQHLR